MERVFASLPLVLYRRYEAELEGLPCGLELLMDHEALDPSFAAERDAIADALAARSVGCRFHAPFRDLTPAGHDPEAVGLARRRHTAALAVAPRFGVTGVSAHPGWDPGLYGTEHERGVWLERATAFWAGLGSAAAAAGVTVALENIFDRDAWALRSLLAALPAAQFGWLLDLGHWHAYSYDGLMPWLEALGERLVAVHVHDNGGRTDDHRALGAGSLPGDEALAALRSLRRPLDWVLENRSVPDLETSIRYLADRSGIAELEAAGARLEKRGARGGRS